MLLVMARLRPLHAGYTRWSGTESQQLRKRAVSKVILCGMLANMCVESHLRDLLENGFEVAVVRDATAGPRHPTRGDGYQAALVNYAFLAHAVVSTEEVVKAMGVPA